VGWSGTGGGGTDVYVTASAVVTPYNCAAIARASHIDASRPMPRPAAVTPSP
jgi:hypothetical protein